MCEFVFALGYTKQDESCLPTAGDRRAINGVNYRIRTFQKVQSISSLRTLSLNVSENVQWVYNPRIVCGGFLKDEFTHNFTVHYDYENNNQYSHNEKYKATKNRVKPH